MKEENLECLDIFKTRGHALLEPQFMLSFVFVCVFVSSFVKSESHNEISYPEYIKSCVCTKFVPLMFGTVRNVESG